MRRSLFALTAFAISSATPAFAESQSERDARRASYIEGFSCWIQVSGQQVRIVYEKNGSGERYGEAGSLPLRWKVESDKFCRTINGAENCANLPARNTGDEAAKFKQMLESSCS